jgi:hypothetical protein
MSDNDQETPDSLPVTDLANTARPVTQEQETQDVTAERQNVDTTESDAQNIAERQKIDTPNGKSDYNETCYNETLYPMASPGSELPETGKASETGMRVRRKPRHPRVYDPAKHCGARSRSNNMLPCTLPKGWGTDHVGESKCKLHGGASKSPAGGRYSTVMRPALKASIERHDADPRPMDLIPEVSLLRALVEDYVGRYDVIRDALLAWHMAIQAGSVTPIIPARLPDITEAGRLIERVARVADTIHRIQTEGSVSLDCFRRLMEAMGSDVARLVSKLDVPEEVKSKLLADIEKDWSLIKVDVNRKPS